MVRIDIELLPSSVRELLCPTPKNRRRGRKSLIFSTLSRFYSSISKSSLRTDKAYDEKTKSFIRNFILNTMLHIWIADPRFDIFTSFIRKKSFINLTPNQKSNACRNFFYRNEILAKLIEEKLCGMKNYHSIFEQHVKIKYNGPDGCRESMTDLMINLVFIQLKTRVRCKSESILFSICDDGIECGLGLCALDERLSIEGIDASDFPRIDG
jgi:hypothetical protein